MRAWPLVIIGTAHVPTSPLQGLLKTDIAGHGGGVAAGLVLGTAVGLAWRGGVRRLPGRRTAFAVAGLTAVAVLAPVPFFGWREPLLATALVPGADAPTTEDGWREHGVELARRFPDDPRAVLGLARTEVRTGDTARGLHDLDRAIILQRRLAPSASNDFRFAAHAEVGGEFFDVGKLDETVAQYGLALAEKPNAEIFRDRGIAEFYEHRPGDALADLKRANAVDPKEGYAVLWLSIVAARSGERDPIDATAPEVAKIWPDKIVAFFDGKLDASSAEAWGATLDLAGDQHRICEAKFYEGEHLLIRGWTTEARPLIEAAARTCPHTFIEYRAAQEELGGRGRISDELTRPRSLRPPSSPSAPARAARRSA